ncbi:MAG: hypothetical protein ACFE0K_04160 [Alcanivorax sp.]|uniref:hypothetical protein n=1 Tax=Alcanivorax sp. TaxID=1872427 RepID=UPI003DA71BB3
MTDRFFLSLLFFLLAQTVFADSRTLVSLRADLGSGSLQPVLARQALVPVPDRVLARWVQDVDIEQFAITGFNENRDRFAARVRLHFSDGGVGFLRLEGEPGARYRLTEWYDYSSGLQLSDLASYGDEFEAGKGKAFLTMLQDSPGAAELADLAAGEPALLALWLAQCSGQPCEEQALAAQTGTGKPAVWQLKQALMASEQNAYREISGKLHVAIGDDPYLWWLEGQFALSHERCGWVHSALRQAWLRHPDNRPLADVALQCHLAMMQQGTAFLDALSESLGADALAIAIRRYYQQQNVSIPADYQPWAQPGEK